MYYCLLYIFNENDVENLELKSDMLTDIKIRQDHIKVPNKQVTLLWHGL